MISGLSMLLVGVLLVLAGQQLVAWIKSSPPTSDPWSAEVEQAIHQSDAAEACRHCSTPQASTAWFCPHCGSAVGPYNNLMPYLQVFSEGEVLRNGVTNKLRRNPLIIFGYLLVSVGCYLFLAPVYWVFLIRNWNGRREETTGTSPAHID